jgi:hypothetical protein
VAIAGLLVVLGEFTVKDRFDDLDMWWHLRLGEITWISHHIPTADYLSYTTNHHPRIAQEWLSQLLIYAAYRFGGYSGLMLWLCLFTAAVLVAGYGLCSLYSGNAKVAFLGAMTVWIFGTSGFAIRPHMVGYLLLIVELILLELAQTRNARWFYFLPPLFALWANAHASFFLGFVVAALVLVSSHFQFRYGLLVAPAWDRKNRRTLAIALALSALALMLNPGGIRLLGYPLDTMFHQPVVFNSVSEWQPLQLTQGRGLALVVVLTVIFLLIITQRKELRLHELLLLALGVWLGFNHRRLVFPCGILVAPVLCRLLANSWEQYRPVRDRPLPNAILLAYSLLIVCLAFPSRQSLVTQVELHSPVKAVQFIQANHLKGPMLNDWNDGGYLIWAAPDYPVFIDGRADIYEWTGIINQFELWATLQIPPNVLLDKYKIGFCLLERNSAVANVLPLLPNWKAIYSDDRNIIFQRVGDNGGQ